MSIHAFGLIVFGKVEGTPLCLIVEQVKIIVLDVVMDEGDQNFFLVVGVRAVISIGAFIDAKREM